MRRLIPLLALPLLLGATTPDAHPALWRARDADTTVWLFGTIHALPPGVRWRDPTLDGALKDAQALVIETLVGQPQEMAALLLRMGTPPAPLPPLVQRVPERDRPALRALIARAGVPEARLDGLETWAAAMLLMQPLLADLGVSRGDGVEETLTAEAKAAGKPVLELETVAAQLGFIDGLSEADQRLFLTGLIRQSGKARAEFRAMLTAWSRGDEPAIARTFDAELKSSPTLRAALLTRRNANWADAIARRMEAEPGTILVAVGAGHLAGADSVQKMLAARGVKVERVR